MYAAAGVVSTELDENRSKIDHAGDDFTVLRNPRNHLTLGDWLGSKTACAGLALRDEQLWRDIARIYAGISDFNRGAVAQPPTAERLGVLVDQLRSEQARLREEIHSNSKWFLAAKRKMRRQPA